MQEMQQSVVISRYVLYSICALIVILAIALFISLTKGPGDKDPKSVVQAESAWIQDGRVVPLRSSNPNDLPAFLSEQGVYSAVWLSKDGRFRWTDLDGIAYPICGEIVAGQIRGCGIEGKKLELTTFWELSVIGTKHNPDCVLGRHLGQTAWVHTSTPHRHPCHH